MPVAQPVENILQSLSAGLLLGAIYGRMCRPSAHLWRDAGHQLRSRRFHDVRRRTRPTIFVALG
jgi:hypothetical protein